MEDRNINDEMLLALLRAGCIAEWCGPAGWIVSLPDDGRPLSVGQAFREMSGARRAQR
jgi:hypothetical protein